MLRIWKSVSERGQNSGTVLKEYNGTNIQQDQQAALSMGNIGNNYAPIDQKPEAFYDANQLRAFNAYAVTFNDGQKHVFLEISIVARKPQ